jgi:phage-related minor tail protein
MVNSIGNSVVQAAPVKSVIDKVSVSSAPQNDAEDSTADSQAAASSDVDNNRTTTRSPTILDLMT